MKQNKFVLIELQFLPPVQYFAKLAAGLPVLLEAKENYVKASYRNRCHIATANGVQRLTVPLRKGKNQQQPISEVHVSYDQNWRAEHWHAIRSGYGSAPFFEHYADDIAAFYFKKKYEFLWDYNLHLLFTLLDLMRIKADIRLTSEYLLDAPPGTLDLRDAISPKADVPDKSFQPAHYPQVFEDRFGFQPNLSALDLLFCCGPAAKDVLERSTVTR